MRKIAFWFLLCCLTNLVFSSYNFNTCNGYKILAVNPIIDSIYSDTTIWETYNNVEPYLDSISCKGFIPTCISVSKIYNKHIKN